MKQATACAFALLISMTVACGEDRSDVGGPGTPHGTPPPNGVAVNATLREWRITADINKVHAGPVKFTVANLGTITHELVVIRTDIPDGKIPLVGTKFDEEGPGVSSPGEVSEEPATAVHDTVIDLEPGHYELVCNIELHYQRGMYIPFDVV